METTPVNGRASRVSNGARTAEVIDRPKRRRFSLAEKRRIVAAADARAPGTLGALLRLEGIYCSLLSSWRKQRDHGDFDSATVRQRSVQKSTDHTLQRRNTELEKKNRKLNRSLQRAELILDIYEQNFRAQGIELEGPEANEND